MADTENFVQQLRENIQHRSAQLDQATISELKENWRSFQSNFESIYALLLNKGILREDPYKKEHHISELTPPKDAPFSESYKDDELSIRLSEFTSLLDFMNNYSSFSVDALSLKQLKNLHGILNFVRFKDFSTGSTKFTTRTFAEVVDKIKKGSDQLAAGAIQSSLNQLSSLSQKLERNLKDLSQFKRQEYKYQVREEILTGLDLGNSVPQEIFTNELKKIFQKKRDQLPYYPELVEEIYQEDFTPEGEQLRNKVLDSLVVKRKDSQAAASNADLKPMLIDALRMLANSTRHIDTALEKVRSNSGVLENRPRSFSEKFKLWIVQLTSGKQERIIYEIEMINPATNMHTNKNIDFENFMTSALKKAKTLNGVLSKTSPMFQKLMNADEDQVYGFLDKSTRDIMEINKTIDALDTFFKTEVPRYERDKIRGTKNEVAAIKGNLHNATQKKHEYLAKKEEKEQLKKLGIQ